MVRSQNGPGNHTRADEYTDSIFEVAMLAMDCPTCGVPFAAPRFRVEICRKDPEDSVYCPNGHEVSWPEKDDEDSETVAELRKDLVLAVHRAEQAEAKAAEAAAGFKSPNGDLKPSAKVAGGLEGKPVLAFANDGRYIRCQCGRMYLANSRVWVGKHLRREHRMDDGAVKAALAALEAAPQDSIRFEDVPGNPDVVKMLLPPALHAKVKAAADRDGVTVEEWFARLATK